MFVLIGMVVMKQRILLLGVIGLLLIICILFIPYQKVLSFTYQDQDVLLAYLPLSKSDTFQIQFTHSIHLSDVIDTYTLKDHQIIQTKLSYQDFAVGMPSNAEGEEIFEVKDGRYYLSNMNRDFPFIDLRVGQVRANHKVVYENRSYQLSNYIKPGEWVRIKSKNVSIWQKLKGVNISG